ncbi:MAG: DUF5050 domain-containing protein [Candidatus Yanofskybacteria bacterium]|nr:DUF5050 domain-containing protein [Candidatus Yanofskybacteria bacterium]
MKNKTYFLNLLNLLSRPSSLVVFAFVIFLFIFLRFDLHYLTMSFNQALGNTEEESFAKYPLNEPEEYRIFQQYLASTGLYPRGAYDVAVVVATVVSINREEYCPIVELEAASDDLQNHDIQKVCEISPYPRDTGEIRINRIISYYPYAEQKEGGTSSGDTVSDGGSSGGGGSIGIEDPEKKVYAPLKVGETVPIGFVLTTRPIKVTYATTQFQHADSQTSQDFEPLSRDYPYYLFTTKINYFTQVNKTFPGLVEGDVIYAVISYDGTAYVGEYSIPFMWQITNNAADQINPSVHSSMVAWEDLRNDNRDIYVFDFKTGTERRITMDDANQGIPSVYNDLIAYADDRHGNIEIYLYNLTTQTETRITNADGFQTAPLVFGRKVYYIDQQEFYAQIYEYDVDTQQHRKVADGYGWPTPNYLVYHVFDNYLVFDEMDNFGTQQATTAPETLFGIPETFAAEGNDLDMNIHVVNLSSGTEIVLKRPDAQMSPHIYETSVVWQDFGSPNFDINACTSPCQKSGEICTCPEPISHIRKHELTTGEETVVSVGSEPMLLGRPLIYGSRVVSLWGDISLLNANIYMVDLLSLKEFPIKKDAANRRSLDFYKNYAVIESDRTGNWDIFLHWIP